MSEPTRRSFLRGAAAVTSAAAITLPTITAAASVDPLPALVAEWEPLFRAAATLGAEVDRHHDEMNAEFGACADQGAILFSPKIWWSVADVDAYYAPIIARGTYTAEEIRDRYLAKMRAIHAERKRRGLAELEDRVAEAWRRPDEIEHLVRMTSATSAAALVAKARFALVSSLWPDDLDDEPKDWPPTAKALASLISDLGGKAPTGRRA